MLCNRNKEKRSDIAGDALIACTPHEVQRFLDPGFGKDIEIGCLLELSGESLFQCTVEYGVAGGINEISEQNSVSFRKLGRPTRAEE